MVTKDETLQQIEQDLAAALEYEFIDEQKKYWQLHPIKWLSERFGEEEYFAEWSQLPEYKKHEHDGDKDPLAQAWRSLAAREWTSIQAATATSKTFMAARIVLWFLDCFPNSLVVTSAPKESQLKLHLWAEIGKIFPKFKKLNPKAKLYSLRLVMDDTDVNTVEEDVANSAWQAVGFVCGTGADEQSATKAQGFHREDMLIITEETPGMNKAVLTAFENTSTGDNNLILAMGNPDSEFDTLGQFSKYSNVNSFRISAYDYPNVVCKDSSLMAGAVTQTSINRRALMYGEESGLFKSRVRGLFPKQSEDSLIKYEWVERCVDADPLDSNDADVKRDLRPSYNAVGVDVANSATGDKAALAWGEGHCLMKIVEFQCTNANHLAYNLIYTSEQLEKNNWTDYDTATITDYDVMPEMIGVDSNGLGIATLNTLMDFPCNCYPVPLHGGTWKEVIPEDEGGRPMYKFQTLRAQMYWEAREDLRKGLIGIFISDPSVLLQLKKELCIPKFWVKDTYTVVESKEAIKKRLGGKSPNLADAFIYWNWTRKGYRFEMEAPIAGGI